MGLGGLPRVGAIAEIQNMPGFRAAIREVNTGLKDAASASSQLANQSGTTSQALSGLASVGVAVVTTAVAALVAGILALVAGMALVGTSGLAMNANLEQTEIRLNTLTGMGRETLQWVRDLSVVTPFTTETLSNALSMASAYGFTNAEARDLVQVTGDVDAAFAGQGQTMQIVVRALGQMRSAGKVMGQDMLQLTSAGIPAWKILADAMGLSTAELREMVEKGLVPAEQAIPILVQALEERFGGAMIEQSRTAKGLFDTLRETMLLAAADVTAPLFEDMKVLLEGITDILTGPSFKAAIADLADLIRDLGSGFNPGAMVSGFRQIVEAAREAIAFIQQILDEVRGLSGADIMAGASNAVAANNAALADSLARLGAAHSSVLEALQDDLDSAASSLTRSMGDIASKYGEKLDELKDRLADIREQVGSQMAKAQADLTQKLTDNQKQLEERLTSMAEQHADRRASITDSIADKQFSHEEQLTDLRDGLEEQKSAAVERFADDRARLQEEMAAAETDEQRAVVQAKLTMLDEEERATLAKLEEKERKTEERIQKKHDREIAMLQAKLVKEDESYNAQVAKETQRAADQRTRIQADYDQQVAQLGARLAKEEEAITKQQNKLAQQRAAEEAQVQEQYNAQVAALQARIANENAAYAEQSAQLQAQADAENARIIARAEERAAALGQGPAHEIAVAIQEIQRFIGEVQSGIDRLIASLGGMQAAGLAVGGVFGLIFAGVLEQIGGLQPIFDGIGAWFKENGPFIQATLETIGVVAGKAFNVIKTVWIEDVWPSLERTFKTLSETLGGLGIDWNTLAQVISAVVILVLAILVGLVTGIVYALELASKGIQMFVTGAKDFIEGFFKFWSNIFLLIGDLLRLDFPAALDHAGKALEGTVQLWKGIAEMLLGVLETAFGLIFGLIAGFVEGFIDFFVGLYDELVGHSIIPDMVDRMVEIFKEVDWLSLGKSIVDGLIKGINDQASKLITTLAGLADKAIKEAKKKLGIKSPSAVFASIGRFMMTGLEKGIQIAASLPVRAVQAVAGASALAGSTQVPVITPSPRVVVQGGSTSVDRSVQFNANYTEGQKTIKDRDDLRLATFAASMG